MSTKEQSKPVKREGLQALYTFTPFKIQRTDPYRLILAPVAYHKTNKYLNWRSQSTKDEFSVPITEKFTKRIIQPHELYVQTFSRDSSQSIIYKRGDLDKKSCWRPGSPVYMEYSPQSMRKSMFCNLGLVTSCSEQRCPVRQKCPNYKPTGTERRCTFYQGPRSYPQLYNVYPRIRRKFEDPIAGVPWIPVFSIKYKDLPLCTFRYTNRGSFQAYIDGVNFYPKLSWINYTSSVFLLEGIGFQIANVHALEMEFNLSVLRKMVDQILREDEAIRAWVLLKYYLYFGKEEEELKEKRGFGAFDRMYDVVKQSLEGTKEGIAHSIRKKIKENEVQPHIVKFASFLLLHGLAHVFKDIIVGKAGCREQDISYELHHPFVPTIGVPSEKTRIVIFETATGGYGYIRSIVDEITQRQATDTLVQSMRTKSKAFHEVCEDRSESSVADIEGKLALDKEHSEELVDNIVRAYQSTFPDSSVYPHLNAIRRVIDVVIPDMTSQTRDMLDDLLEKGPLCWDGCQLCVMFERECNYLPFDQPFFVSERLTRKALDLLISNMRHPHFSNPLKEGVMDKFQELKKTAGNEIDLVSPWLSPQIVESLIDELKDRGVKIKIITTVDDQNEVQVRSIRRLERLSKNLGRELQVRIADRLHAKGMCVDSVVLLHGSFNFTFSGLNSNVENVMIDYDIGSVRKFKKQFEELWKEAELLGDES